MSFLRHLFFTPDIARLTAKKDIKGLTEALTFTRNDEICRAAARALLCLNAYPQAFQQVIQNRGKDQAQILLSDVRTIFKNGSESRDARVAAARFLLEGGSDSDFNPCANFLLEQGELPNSVSEWIRLGEEILPHRLLDLAQNIYEQPSQSLWMRAQSARCLVAHRKGPYADFLIDSFITLFHRFKSLFVYDSVINSSVPLFMHGNGTDDFATFSLLVSGLLSLPQDQLADLLPLLKDKDDFMVAWVSYIVGRIGGDQARSALVDLLQTHPNLDLCGRVLFNLKLTGWTPSSPSESVAALVATPTAGERDFTALGSPAVRPMIELLGSRELKTGGRLRDGRERRNVYIEVIMALGKIRDSQAVPVLCSYLKGGLGRFAASALQMIGSREALPALYAALHDKATLHRDSIESAINALNQENRS